jgi:4-hydroxy-tetrahydrodipicolinate reductase
MGGGTIKHAGRAGDLDRVRLALLGFGRVGRAVLELAATRPWIDVCAVVARRIERHGELAAATVTGAPPDLTVRTDIVPVLREAAPDVVIMATSSRLLPVREQLEAAFAAGTRTIISTSEELAYTQPGDSSEARAIHELVDAAGATVVTTGVNPGFVLDLWPLLLAGLAWDVERIEARRVVDVSVFAPHARVRLGIGHEPAAFEAGVADGSIAGHLGFRESLRLLCDSMGLPAERISVDTEPLFADHVFHLADDRIEPGRTVGASQRAVAWRDGKAWISLELLLHAAPAQAGIPTIDETHIRGRHELHATLDPGAAAILSTAALLVNTIPAALRAGPGIHGSSRLPPSAPWLAANAPQGLVATPVAGR